MTSVEITHEMAALLVALGSRPHADLEALAPCPNRGSPKTGGGSRNPVS